MSFYKALAIKAVEDAEKRLAEEDFVAAKTLILNAQSLCPELEGIPQMLKSVDVYIASKKKINSKMDWYGVLGVDPSADDDAIKKQYKKMALALHPDKNRTTGADGAFKLISNAWSFLSDKEDKLAYDRAISNPPNVASSSEVVTKTRQEQCSSARPPNADGIHTFRAASRAEVGKETSSPHPSATFGTHNPPNTDYASNFFKGPSSVDVGKNATGEKFSSAPGPHPSANTVWTVCHICQVEFAYDRLFLNQILKCYNCDAPFYAFEIPPPVDSSKPPGSS